MGLLRARIRASAADCGGFTLIELLVASVLALIVIGGAVMAVTASFNDQPRLNSQAFGVQQARTTMEQITRELRQGSSVPTATSSQLAIVTYIRNSNCGTSTPVCRVTYNCSAGACTRTVSKPDGTSPGSATQVVSGLSSDNVFTYTAPTSTAPGYVGVTLAFPPQGSHQGITVNDGAALRNPAGS
jgi:prepilin-type N-terminal cleavage/methylation domain-containing protein